MKGVNQEPVIERKTMKGYEFDPEDKKGSFRDRFDFYCKEVIYHAAHNMVYRQAQYLRHQFGGMGKNPDTLVVEDDYGDLFAAKMSVRGKEVVIRDDGLVKMLMKLQDRKREILLMNYMLDMTLSEIAGELGLEYETVKSTKSKAIRELRKGAVLKSEET